mmetsp:Transcript_96689/g.167813  ORF Transcript_96689/g.167813 Transcript_96689/m.167813 type:complete len:522 (-) Transcript_96689:114-1679(-)
MDSSWCANIWRSSTTAQKGAVASPLTAYRPDARTILACSVLLGVVAAMLAASDRWCPIPVVAEEFVVVAMITLASLGIGHSWCDMRKRRATDQASASTSADRADVPAASARDISEPGSAHQAEVAQDWPITVRLLSGALVGVVRVRPEDSIAHLKSLAAQAAVAFDMPGGHFQLVSGTQVLVEAQTIETAGLEAGAELLMVQTEPPGVRVATASEDGLARLWRSGYGGRCERVLEGHDGSVCSIALFADGAKVVTGSADGTARIWDAESGECILVIEVYGGVVYSVRPSPCGSFILTGSDDHTAQLWCSKTGQWLRLLEGHEGTVASVDYSPCGAYVATGSHDCSCRLWCADTGNCESVFEGHDAAIFSVAFSSCGSLIASGSHDGTARLWSVGGGWCVLMVEGHDAAVRSVALSPVGNFFASGSVDGTIRLWNVSTGSCMKALRPAPKKQAAAGAGAKQTAADSGFGAPVFSLAFSADGDSLVATSGDTARIWDVETGRCTETFQHDHRVEAVAAAPAAA